jgi:hypothetical protein
MKKTIPQIIISGAVMVVGLGFIGCASPKPEAVVQGGAPSVTRPIRLAPGRVGVISPAAPAQFRFDEAQGRVELASDAAGNAAGRVLETPNFNDPALEMAAGAVRFALAPFAAAAGALGPGQERMSPGQLAGCQSDIRHALERAGDQELFRQSFLKSGSEKIPQRLVTVEPPLDSSVSDLSAVLEAGPEEITLEHTGPGDLFALHIKTRVRLLDPGDGTLLYEQPFEFRSGKALFIDWTRKEALQGVVDTGYRELADHMIDQLFSNAIAEPILVGAGYQKDPSRFARPCLPVALHRYNAAPMPAVEFASAPVATRGLAAGRSATTARPQFVRDELVASGFLGIYATSAVTRVTFQRPLTKEQASSEAVEDVEWALDGLDNSQNSVVMLIASAVAVPMSLWSQAVAGVRGLTTKDYRAAEERLLSVLRQTRLQDQLAMQVAQQLAPKTIQPIRFVKGSVPAKQGAASVGDAGAPSGAKSTLCATTGNAAAEPGPADQALPYELPAGGDGTILQIHVLSVALSGIDAINPPMALSVKARVTLLRAADGQTLYSTTVEYRGRQRSFKQWAAHDAQLFRQEIQQSNRQLARAIVDQLISQKLIFPQPTPYPTVAAVASGP